VILLCTAPGKHGDILWSLPTVRAVGETFRTSVDLLVSERYGTHRDLLALQPYIRHVHVSSRWREADGRSAWEPFESALHHEPLETPEHDRVIHLGYRSRPDKPLPEFIYAQAASAVRDVSLAPLRLDIPWIEVRSSSRPPSPVITVGWSDDRREYQAALVRRLQQAFPSVTFVSLAPDADWIEAARQIESSDLFLGSCSALHVVACALGRPAVIVEPDGRRWDPVLYPFGTNGPRTYAVRTSGAVADDVSPMARVLDQVLARTCG
jgi:ADP-heptose:LPS heptosyltransferase